MLDRSVLVLNKSWTPIAITTVKRGFSLVFQDHAHIVHPETYEMHDFETWLGEYALPADATVPEGQVWARTATLQIRVPEVIVLGRYNGVPRRELAFNRRNIYRRDEFQCQYCAGRPGPTYSKRRTSNSRRPNAVTARCALSSATPHPSAISGAVIHVSCSANHPYTAPAVALLH